VEFDPEQPLEFFWSIDRRRNSIRVKMGRRSLMKIAAEDIERSINSLVPGRYHRFVKKFTMYEGKIIHIGWRF